MPHIHPKATIQTWGTGNFGSNGMLNFLDTELFGGNVGHAAIELKFPADEAGEQLIQQYCMKENEEVIPFEKMTFTAPDGTEEQYYIVRFSWWPSTDGSHVLNSLEGDQLDERTGVRFDYADRFSEFATDKRIYRGLLGEQEKTLAPLVVTHLRNAQDIDPQKNIILILQNIKILGEFIKSIELLQNKLQQKLIPENKDKNSIIAPENNIRLSKTELLMLHNLLPKEEYNKLKTKFLHKSILSREDVNEISSIVNKCKEDMQEKLKNEEKLRADLQSDHQQLSEELGNYESLPHDIERVFSLLQEKLLVMKK